MSGRVCSDGWDPAEVARPSDYPIWPWERDRLADALRACRRKASKRGADMAETARMCALARRLVRRAVDESSGAGGGRRVLVRACARWAGVDTAQFVLAAIDHAISEVVARCPNQVLPVTRREGRALAVAILDGARGGCNREDLNSLVEGGEI